MKALTITQPWASLIACGAKHIETRTWAPAWHIVGQRIAIHAAKGWTADDRELLTTEPFRSALREGYRQGYIVKPDVRDLPRGGVIAIAKLQACYAMQGSGWEKIQRLLLHNPNERAFGGYGMGRYGWHLTDVRAIEPIPARGALGLWDWEPPDWLTYLDTEAVIVERIVRSTQATGKTGRTGATR